MQLKIERWSDSKDYDTQVQRTFEYEKGEPTSKAQGSWKDLNPG